MGNSNTTSRGVSAAARRRAAPIIKMHYKCRGELYPRGQNIRRFPVPDDKVSWAVPWPEYKPITFTSDSVNSKPVWADPDFASERDIQVNWNVIDGSVDRRSHNGAYEVVNGLPRNPVGRTGIYLRGTLGRWGPNHAADPIVTRWKRDESGNVIMASESGRPQLQFIAIQRRDSGEWALPGGMVDAGENISITLKREFSEEALNALEASPEEIKRIEASVTELFKRGLEIYRGYVDDPRNTDNSWMETIAVNFHDESGNSVGMFRLHAGDDAVGVRWTDIHQNLKLYASHANFIKTVAERHNAHW